jgi:hypothetical protein
VTDIRSVNPDDLEELARLLDGGSGGGGLEGALSDIFTRATGLNASDEVSALRPIQTWASETAPDLRRRAGYARLDEGDPTAGLLLAGFTPEELANYGEEVSLDDLITLNALAANGNAEDDVFTRQHREEIDEYLARIAAHYAEQLPFLEGHAETIQSLIMFGIDGLNVSAAGGVVLGQTMSLYRVWRGYPGAALSAPGTWLPGQLARYLRTNPTINRLLMIPGQRAYAIESAIFGRGWDLARSSTLANRGLYGLSANSLANFLVGNDRLARLLSYHPGMPVDERIAYRATQGTRAANASMWRIGRNTFSGLRALGNTRWAATTGAVFNSVRATGTLRFIGVGGSVLGTGFSIANVVAQGNPIDAWNEAEGVQGKAGYLADWAEVGFNASLTAAMVAPNPVTVGLAIGTGIAYAGLKVVEHWDDVTEFVGNAVDTVADFASDAVDTVTEIGSNIVEGVSDFIGSLF